MELAVSQLLSMKRPRALVGELRSITIAAHAEPFVPEVVQKYLQITETQESELVALKRQLANLKKAKKKLKHTTRPHQK